MPLDTQKLRELSTNLEKFLEFEREIELSVRQEDEERRRDIEEQKRAQEKKARRKRLKRMRQAQSQ
jgi:hypothetical protein